MAVWEGYSKNYDRLKLKGNIDSYLLSKYLWLILLKFGYTKDWVCRILDPLFLVKRGDRVERVEKIVYSKYDYNFWKAQISKKKIDFPYWRKLKIL